MLENLPKQKPEKRVYTQIHLAGNITHIMGAEEGWQFAALH